MDEPFESAWLKWAWAVIDADLLQKEMVAFSQQPNLEVFATLEQRYYPRRHCIVMNCASDINPFPIHWGLMLGNTVVNFRSCLDHLAWALYKRGGTPNLSERQEKDVYFPIAYERVNFNASLGRKLPGVRRADIAIVRRYQPYHHARSRQRFHILSVLDKLSKLDKHRAIQPVAAIPEEVGYTIIDQQDCVFRRLSRRQRRSVLEPGTELGRFYVLKTGPKPKLQVQPRFTFNPSVHERATLDGWLAATARLTRELLMRFAPLPDSAKAILRDRLPAHG